MFDLTGFQRDILYCIAGAETPSGPTIRQDLEEYHTGTVNHSRLYQNLSDLIEEGYLTKGSINDRTNRYQLTAAGRQLLADRQEWETAKLSETPL